MHFSSSKHFASVLAVHLETRSACFCTVRGFVTDIRWPVAADYDESIQNPHLNFDDAELKSGEVEYDKFGSPSVRSGNFASVYMVETSRRKIAVRCFLREVSDQQERYAAISHDLLGLQLPYTVNFEYVKKGIRVSGEWFPILKMDWCEGELLDEYLEKNLDSGHKLHRLADKWYEMSVALKKQGIAHGDLQHGNVMVLDDEFKLIDYDGMFVPRLAGRVSNERGLEHYQHPKRTEHHFGRYLDNFSNWVTYTTLLSLAEDKSLWRLANLQDKHLIFNKADFEAPERSSTFRLLKSHDNKTIRTYAVTLENLLYFDVDKIPDFNPDKPILFPPQHGGAPLVNLSVAGLPKVPVDKGYLFEPKPESEDKGNLYPSSTESSDKGHLFADQSNASASDAVVTSEAATSDQNVSTDTKTRPRANPVLVSVVVALCIFGIGGCIFYVISNSQPKIEETKGNLLLGINDAQDAHYQDAKKRFEMVTSNPNATPRERSNAYCLLALTYVGLAGDSGDKEKLKESVGIFKQSIEADGKNAEAYYALGRTYEALGQKAEAYSRLKKAASLDKNQAAYQAALAKYEGQQKAK